MATKKSSSSKSAARATRQAKSAAAAPLTGGRARTIIYVHGIGNKPLPDILKCQWDQALFGYDLGDKSRLAYWVNRIAYPEPVAATCQNADATRGETHGGAGLGARALGAATPESLAPPDATPAERKVLGRMAAEALASEKRGGLDFGAKEYGARLLPLPPSWREVITRQITRLWLKDVSDFLFDQERRDAMRQSLIERLENGSGPFVVIGHSQGSMVAYDVLNRPPKGAKYDVELFVTVGSPLGLTEVQDQLKKLSGQKSLSVPENVARWLNVADPLDAVAADKTLADDYRARGGVSVTDARRWNKDSPRDPHSGTGYLRLDVVREAVFGAVQRECFQRISPFKIARDVVKLMENGRAEERHPVLIELREEFPDRTPRPLQEVREEVANWIRQAAKHSTPRVSAEELDLEDELQHYVSANLTRSEVERIAEELHVSSAYRVFQNSRKKALLDHSSQLVQAPPAHRGYDACGQEITWAVLDSGIDPEHPHFQGSIARIFDCLRSGKVVERPVKDPAPGVAPLGVDRNGHGTHVAGIIAGRHPERDRIGISGIAPAAAIISYKVLDDDGRGSDAKIIKALDHIFALNHAAQDLVIHGVNLSLGGPFDPQVFGCGDSPLCKQLRRLWRQGVVVVLAAGNEGYLEFQQGEEAVGVNMDLSIGDPANLEEAIAVGSVHKKKPHIYGTSFFSSRGPTADGRAKPDLVAPGERILSCRAGGKASGDTLDDLYLEMSGTSMAAPHVSGVVACFLSVRREFIGYPDRVKAHLLANCTDLKRDRMNQGAGMPNLVKMLLNT